MTDLKDILSTREYNSSQLAKYQRRVDEAMSKGQLPKQTDINALNYYTYASNNWNKKYGDGKLEQLAKKEIKSINKDIDFYISLLNNYTNSSRSQGGMIGQISQNGIEKDLNKLNDRLLEWNKVAGGQYKNIGNITTGYTPTPTNTNKGNETPAPTNTPNPTYTPTKKTNTSTIKTTAPKVDTTQFGVAPEGWTQDEWNQSMAMYKADSEHYYDTQRNKQVGNTGKTQDQIFNEGLEYFAANPQAATSDEIARLTRLSQNLGYAYGYKNGNPEDHKRREAGYTSNGIQTPTTNNTAPTQQTQTTVQRTVSESPAVSINDQARRGFKTNDTTGYYSGQNPGIRNLYL